MYLQSNGNSLILYFFSFLSFLPRVWDLEGNEKAHFVLRSAGMSVCWHPEEAFKVVVFSLTTSKITGGGTHLKYESLML